MKPPMKPIDSLLAKLERHAPASAAFLRDRLGEAPEPARGAAARAPARPSSPPSPSSSAAQRFEARRARQHEQRRQRSSRANRRARLLEREERYLARLHARLTSLGVPWVSQQRIVPFRVWLMCAAVIADRSGKAARLYLSKLKNRPAAGAILRASVAPERGAERRSWADLRTRRIAALGLALVHLAESTRRRDQWGGGLVRGLSQGALRALLRDPFDARRRATPSRSALAGRHRKGATAESGQIGYLVALQSEGLLYAQQLPATAVGAEEVGPSGWALNRYWIVTDALELAAEWAARTVISWVELAAGDARALHAQLARARAAPA